MKALTLWPEWCWAIRRLGKNVENRTWRPPDTLRVGEPIAIHAGASFGGKMGEPKTWSEIFSTVATMARRSGWKIRIDVDANIIMADNLSHDELADDLRGDEMFSDHIVAIPCGGVVAVAVYDGVLMPGCDGPKRWPWWAEDQFGWVLKDVKPIKRVRCAGRQRLWNLPREIEEAVTIQLRGKG